MKPVILGAGLAGLTTALSLSPLPVILVSPFPLGEGCASAWAQGGIAAVVGADDSYDLHIHDTLAVGGDLNDSKIVRQTIQDGAAVIEKFIASGVCFDRDTQGKILLGLEAAHQRRRIVHAADATGLAVVQALIALARATPSIEIIENATAKTLLVNDGIAGVVLQKGDEEITLATHTVVLATGGATALWRDTTNPLGNWGSGLLLAARAGATLGDLEFVQFHPTAIDLGRNPMPLATEALRGEGAVLIDETGARFIDELQPRDIVARAIWQQIAQGHRVFLDASKAIGKNFSVRFPNTYALCLEAHIDPTYAPIPVRPAAHYHMGGVLTDAHGRTDVKGLWACGEVACTGLHGANRLASNSLLEAASFGKRVAEDIAGSFLSSVSGTRKSFNKSDEIPLPLREGLGKGCNKQQSAAFISPSPSPSLKGRGTRAVFADRQVISFQEKSTAMEERPRYLATTKEKIRATMSDSVGLIRDRAGLKQALAFLSPLTQTCDMALIGAIIASAALQREESRGAHYRTDFPQTNTDANRSTFRLTDRKNF